MKWLNGYKMRLAAVGCVTAIVLGGGVRAKADFIFDKPENIGSTLNTTVGEGGMSISSDGLTLYFSTGYTGAVRPGGHGQEDIWMTTRSSLSGSWGAPVNLGPPVNSAASEAFASISADGLTLYFCDFFYGSARPGGVGGKDLWRSSRSNTDGPWGEPVNLGPVVNSAADDVTPTTSADGLTLIFASNRGSGGWQYDLWMSTRPSTDSEWDTPVNMGPVVNSSSYDGAANLSSDGLLLFFTSTRSGGLGEDDIWLTTRKSVTDPWGPPLNLEAPINTSVADAAPEISANGRMLYFDSPRPGTHGHFDLWQVPIEPVVDLNVDGIIDSVDMCIIVDHWGENYSLCDIGPMPWGDGIVHVEDLIVLAEHLFTYPGAVAYWKLDETDGDIAHDNIAGCNGTLIGGPTWQPTLGMVAGALQFDGTDDYVRTDFVLNPADGIFSVVAWLKGGAPGQAILSQEDGASWLCIDAAEGCLMTEIKTTGRSGKPLLSQTNITAGTWHRIGFVWDGSYRHLYVDGVEVAKDAAPLSDLESAEGSLYFGVGSTLAPGSFFTGLIDDIRIYNRVVSP